MRNRSMWWGIAALLAAAGLSHAGPLGPLTTFTAGTPAKASEVNGNFSVVSTAVNDNASRITTLESTVTPAGNIVLVPSTASAGNILKGTLPFIHNFGNLNTFIGAAAGNFTMTGKLNTGSGASALESNTTGDNNTASGAFALESNTTGFGNTASGAAALQFNTLGSQNTASGLNALGNNNTGDNNTASGAGALQNNIAGFQNTAIGVGALQNNNFDNNTASGFQALFSNTTGVSNTASGVLALGGNTTGFQNTAIGAFALQNNRGGSGNIAFGFRAGRETTGNNNITIGNRGAAGDTGVIRIGDVQTRAFIAGIRGVTTVNTDAINVMVDSDGQLGTASSSRRVKDAIADMGKASGVLMKLRPVTFHYKSERHPATDTLQYGLVAEEVAQVAPGLVARSADGEIETVYYQFLAPMLLNEYQKQQRTIEAQTARLAELEKQNLEIAELKRQMARMAGLLGRLEHAGVIATAGR